MNNSNNLSRFIVDNNFFSFIDNAVINCDFLDFPILLENYLSIANKYKISFKYSHIKSVISLVITENSINTYYRTGSQLTPTPNDFKKNYIWPNGLVFLNKLFQENSHYIQEFIQDDFLNKSTKIILNYNKYLLNNCSDQSEFHSFFELILNSLDKTLFDKFYSKNNLYINKKTTPYLRSLTDKLLLEYNLNNYNNNKSKNLKI